MRTLLLIALLSASSSAAEFNPNNLFVARSGTGVLEYDHDGFLIQTFSIPGAISVDFGPDGHMYVPTGSGVVEMDADGNTIRTFADAGLSIPLDVAFGGAGDLYITDPNNDQVVVFDREGTFLRTIGNSTVSDTASAVTIGPDGHVWVSCLDPSEIVEFDSSGAVVKTFGSGFLIGPREMSFGPDGMLYAIDAFKVMRIDPETGALTDSTAHSNGWGIGFGGDGLIRVTDYTGFYEVMSWDAVDSFQSFGSVSVDGTSTTGGVACGPYRFKVSLKGRYSSSATSYNIKQNAVLTYIPGTWNVFLDFADGNSAFSAGFAGHGLDAREANGKSRRLLAHEVLSAPTVFGYGSLSLSIKGKQNIDGFFIPKKITGTFDRAGSGVSIHVELKSKKLLK